MLKYIVKRLLLGLLILFGTSVIIYFLVRSMPADYIDINTAAQVSQGKLSAEDVARMKELYGIGDNSLWGIIGSYFTWLGNLFKGDLGISFIYGRSVAEVIRQYMWVSFGIAFVALIFQIIIAIPLGIYAATKQYSVSDYSVTVLAMMGISLPSFFFAALLLRVFSVGLGWFPLVGLRSAETMQSGFPAFLDLAHHLVLPIITLVVLSIGGLMRYTRTNMLEVLNSDYIRTARAKGLSEKTVIYKHAFRNTLIPIVTMLGGVLPTLFGGAMIVESVFAINGIGFIAYKAVLQADVPFVMGYNMFLAVLTVLGILISDILYMVVDPRVKLK
ncbi:MAG: diguanylate cyclase [Firmicutes bacterium HGW-Firmicutes-21]|nr:MAG: diguanylate cyclase [Firmicutes bacterium HGW-Firmicutes-21]